jgi:hypothetical protein
MEKIKVSYLKSNTIESIQEISGRLNELERHPIDQMLWSAPSYKPGALFSIAYSDDSIFLKYFVRERSIRVSHSIDNSPVHQDSCVEFFICFENDDKYYNLEFNCIGTCSFGFGESRTGRQLISTEVTSKIKRQAVINSCADKGRPLINWELTLVIPFEVFIHHNITSLKGIYCKGNFYKCGDALPEPHFLSWQDITAEAPNFHLPEFFGSMQFV